MAEIERIHSQLQNAYRGGAWHGSSVAELLARPTAQVAAARPIPTAHSIWEILLHMGSWQTIVGRRLAGEPAEQVPPSLDWPPLPTTIDAAAWRGAVEAAEDTQDRLMAAVASTGEERLDDTVVGTPYTVYTMLHGLVQHDLYHAGQIALLLRAAESG